MAVEVEVEVEDFWANPPWEEGIKKHRLGLRLIYVDDWLKSDVELLANKCHLLKTRYHDVVRQDPQLQSLDYSSWGLPWSIEGDHPDWIANLGAGIAEDICLLDLADQQRLIAGCVVAPSYWSLEAKLGLPMWQIHQPVEGMNAKIGDNVRKFLANIPLQSPFYRYNWFVHDEGSYFPKGPATFDVAASNWVIRSEQQVLYRPSESHLLLTIRVLFAQLKDAGLHPHALPGLRASLELMDEDEINHFGGVAKHRRLVEYVRQL